MRIRTAALACLTALAAGACSSDKVFLTETPYDFVSPVNFWKTSADALAGINGVYADFINSSGDNYYGRNLVMLVEYPTEMVTSRLSATNERSQPDVYTIPVSHAYTQSIWQAAYDAINRCNAVIGHVPEISMDTTLRKRIVGEAKFLRALHYFNLVRLWGGVPLKITETAALENLVAPRNTAAEVYAQIVKDLQEAIPVLPSSKTYGTADWGRASRGAAKTLLAKVYLQRAGTGVGTAADWQASLDMSRQVVADGDYALVADYKSLFDFFGGTIVEKNLEVVFDVENLRAPGLGGRIGSHMPPVNSGVGASTNGSFEAESTFYNSYKPGDKRQDGTWIISYVKAGTTVNWTNATVAANPFGSDTPFPRKFLDPLMTGTGAEEPNYIILRYAEVQLMIAEAANEVSGGPTAEAYTAINLIHTRAGIPALTAGLSQSLFRDSVFVERRWELSLEGPNGYFDDQRNWTWSTARINAQLARARTSNSRQPKFNGGPIPDKYKLMPIPQRALDLNSKLVQNPGW